MSNSKVMNITDEKTEIIEWINSIDNPAVLEKIKQIKHETTPFDFEKEWENSISSEEFKKSAKKFLSSLNWDK